MLRETVILTAPPRLMVVHAINVPGLRFVSPIDILRASGFIVFVFSPDEYRICLPEGWSLRNISPPHAYYRLYLIVTDKSVVSGEIFIREIGTSELYYHIF